MKQTILGNLCKGVLALDRFSLASGKQVTVAPARRTRRHISYCISFNSARYVRVVWSDGSVEIRYPGDKGYKNAKSAATRQRF
jgi:hypothetical protein